MKLLCYGYAMLTPRHYFTDFVTFGKIRGVNILDIVSFRRFINDQRGRAPVPINVEHEGVKIKSPKVGSGSTSNWPSILFGTS